jgi:hypothetical protein
MSSSTAGDAVEHGLLYCPGKNPASSSVLGDRDKPFVDTIDRRLLGVSWITLLALVNFVYKQIALLAWVPPAL